MGYKFNEGEGWEVTESDLMHLIQVALSRLGHRLFRNNCGSLKDALGRWLQFGVANPGGSDLIGWTKNGRFLALEIKTQNGRVRVEQRAFIAAVRAAGGYAGIARTVEDAEKIADGIHCD